MRAEVACWLLLEDNLRAGVACRNYVPKRCVWLLRHMREHVHLHEHLHAHACSLAWVRTRTGLLQDMRIGMHTQL